MSIENAMGFIRVQYLPSSGHVKLNKRRNVFEHDYMYVNKEWV